MKVLLKEDVDNLGSCGDEVQVKDGYGRNYLIPRGKAIMATPRNMKAFNHQKGVVQARLRKFKNIAQEVADRIAKVQCVFTKKVGDLGKLFGSVTKEEIAEAMKNHGIEIDRRKIQISEPIKALGEFQVPLKLHAEVIAQIKVIVVKEENAAEAKEEVKTEGNA